MAIELAGGGAGGGRARLQDYPALLGQASGASSDHAGLGRGTRQVSNSAPLRREQARPSGSGETW